MSALLESIAFNADVIKPWWAGTAIEAQARVKRFHGNIPSELLAKEAGLDWEPVKTEVSYADFFGEVHKTTAYTGWLRSDSGTLLAINGPSYHVFHNHNLIAVVDALTKEGKGSYLAGGVLDRGRRVWVQLDAGQFEITKRSGAKLEVKQTLFAYNAHDGSGALVIKYTTTFVVCFNTAQIAVNEGGSKVRIKHTTGISNFANVTDRARKALEIGGESWESQRAVLQQLAVTPCGEKVAREFFAALLTDTENAEDARRAALTLKDEGGRAYTIFAKKGERLMENFRSGLGNSGESFLDALQAVTQAVDHQEFRSDEWKSEGANISRGFDSANFGSGSQLKQQAVALAQKWVA